MSTNWTFEDNNMSNAKHAPGLGPVGGNSQGLYAESATALFPLGYCLRFDDGRVFRYGQATAAINRGLLVSPDVSANCVAETDGSFTAAAIGATQVTASDATIGGAGADDFAGGYLHITDDDGEGFTYRIKSNTAGSSNSVTLDLYDGLVVAITTDTDYAITGNMYDELRAATSTDPLISGVSMISMTAEYFGWFQTWGVATVLSDGTTTQGGLVTLSDGTAGAVQPIAGGGTTVADLTTEPVVGYTTFAGDSTGHVGVFLQIAP